MSQRDSEAGSAFSLVAAASSAANSGMVDVGLLDDLRQKKRPMLFELGVAPAAARLGYEASTHANRFHQVHHEGDRHFEMGRGGVTRLAALDQPDSAFTRSSE